MSITSLEKDFDNLSLTLIMDFDYPVERIWRLYADPRQLEQWWGPPGYPATVYEHELNEGGLVKYYMTSPEGQQHHGYWRVLSVEPPRLLEVEDGFADEQGNPNEAMPVGRMRVEFTERAGGTRVTSVSTHASREDLEQLVQMGMEEGLRAAAGQIGAILAADA